MITLEQDWVLKEVKMIYNDTLLVTVLQIMTSKRERGNRGRLGGGTREIGGRK